MKKQGVLRSAPNEQDDYVSEVYPKVGGRTKRSEVGDRKSEMKYVPVRQCSSFNYVGDDDLGVPQVVSLIL